METNIYGITEQLFSRVKNFVNSLETGDGFTRTDLFRAVYGESQWSSEACEKSNPLDFCILMLVRCGYFIRPTIWAGIWTKTGDVPSELTVQKLIEKFEDLQEEE